MNMNEERKIDTREIRRIHLLELCVRRKGEEEWHLLLRVKGEVIISNQNRKRIDHLLKLRKYWQTFHHYTQKWRKLIWSQQ